MKQPLSALNTDASFRYASKKFLNSPSSKIISYKAYDHESSDDDEDQD